MRKGVEQCICAVFAQLFLSPDLIILSNNTAGNLQCLLCLLYSFQPMNALLFLFIVLVCTLRILTPQWKADSEFICNWFHSSSCAFTSPGFGRSPPLMIAGGRVFVFPCIQQLQRWPPLVTGFLIVCVCGGGEVLRFDLTLPFLCSSHWLNLQNFLYFICINFSTESPSTPSLWM